MSVLDDVLVNVKSAAELLAGLPVILPMYPSFAWLQRNCAANWINNIRNWGRLCMLLLVREPIARN